MLSPAELDAYTEDGFVRIDGAFAPEDAAEARAILWRDLAALGVREDDPTTWTRPVVRLGHYTQAPFVRAIRSAALTEAFDQVVGTGRWRPQGAVGTFPVRFPSTEDPGDCGWHVDASFGTDTPDFLEWRVNAASRGRVLLVLMLFSDVGDDDAPTRIRAGSHHDLARRLAPAGDAGMSLRELAAHGFEIDQPRREVLATGPAGTAYVCHPLLVHSAQPHRGTRPRFLAQPPILPA